MKTLYISGNKLKTNFNVIQQALKNHQLIIFPTETVYGIGASIASSEAIQKIFDIKGRPQDNPLIVHIGKESQLDKLIIDPPIEAKLLINSFWPGPLTLVFKKSKHVSKLITAGMDTVAVRMPSHPVAKEFLQIIDTPLCAPSANFSGKPSATNVESVKEDFNSKVSIILEGDPSSIGLESTVLDISKKPFTILRPGVISKEDIETVLNEPIQASFQDEAPRSPGMKYTHYKPFGDVVILDGSVDSMIEYLKKKASKDSVFIGATEICQHLSLNTIALGSNKSLDTIAKNLYRVLRQLDQLKVKTIYTHCFERKGIGEAIMNRLEKAANHNIIHLKKGT